MSVQKVMEIARGELGYTEYPPGSNRTKYWQEYGEGWQGQPWCVAFLWWCFRQAGEGNAFFGGARTASCGTILRWYQEQGLTVPVADTQVGDIVLMNFRGGRDPEHCGLVTDPYWHYDARYVTTIEGNTSPGAEGSQDNGGCVALKRRYPYQIVAVCRPQYKAEEVKPVDDITGHWAEKAINWELDVGISNGYPDGSYRPNAFITRAEDAAKLYRFCEMMEKELSELRAEIARLKEVVK